MNRVAIVLLTLIAPAAWLAGQGSPGAAPGGKTATPANASDKPRVELLTKPPIRFSHTRDGTLQAKVYLRHVTASGTEKLKLSGPGTDNAKAKPPELSTQAPTEVELILPGGCNFKPAGLEWYNYVVKPNPCKPAGGHLLVTNSAAGRSDQSIPLEWTLAAQYSREMETSIFVRAFRLATIAVIVGFLIAWRSNRKLEWALVGDSSWDLKSWATNATIGASLLTGILALTGFPDQPVILPKAEYALLSLWSASLVGLGTATYSAFTRPGKTAGTVVGLVPLFAVSATLILWAASLQILVLLVIVAELAMANVLGPYAEWALGFVLRCALFGVLAYGVFGVQGVLRRKRDSAKQPEVSAAEVTQPASAWSQL